MVGDPCYLSDWKGNELTEKDWYENAKKMSKDDEYEYSYEGACKASCCKDGAGVMGKYGSAVSMRTKYGDGCYPVYLVTNDRGRHALVVEMGDDDEDEDDD